jgi:hypothetical protein
MVACGHSRTEGQEWDLVRARSSLEAYQSMAMVARRRERVVSRIKDPLRPLRPLGDRAGDMAGMPGLVLVLALITRVPL